MACLPPEPAARRPSLCSHGTSPAGPAEDYRQRILELVEEVEREAAAERERTGRAPLGAEAILKQQPTAQPGKTKKSPAPRFHVIAKAVRQQMYEA